MAKSKGLKWERQEVILSYETHDRPGVEQHKPVAAHVKSFLAVHRSMFPTGFWQVTHIPTGRRVCRPTRSLQEGRNIVEAILDWDLAVLAEFQAVTGEAKENSQALREAMARVKEEFGV